MHSSRMRTARSSSRHGGVSTQTPPEAGTPRSRYPPGAGTPQSRHPQSRNPPLCGPGDPPSQIPLNFPLGCGPGDPPRPDPPQLPPWVWAWKPARHAGIPPPPPPLGQTHTCKLCLRAVTKIAVNGGRIDFMFLGPLDSLLAVIVDC